MPKGIILIVFAVSVFAGNVVQAQMPFDLDAELRLRWERRTPAAAEGDQTRGFSRLMLGYETELSDVMDAPQGERFALLQ